MIGVRLADGREVVLKARPLGARLAGCAEVQRALFGAGFPCPEPIAGPAPMGDLAVSAEMYVSGGEMLEPAPDSPRLFAEGLARLVALAPAVADLDPPPPWASPDYTRPGVWPNSYDTDADLNDYPEPAWLTDIARRASHRLGRTDLPRVIGHCDWESQNIRWVDRRLHCVHDWDSAVSLPEAHIAGLAAAVFPNRDGEYLSTMEEAEAFLAAYEQARGRPWSTEEREIAHAAGLWIMAYDVKKDTVGDGSSPFLDRLDREADTRLRIAGA